MLIYQKSTNHYIRCFVSKIIFIVLISAFLIVFATQLVCGVRAFAVSDSGSCGENLTWSYNDGVLIISGNGEMYNYYSMTEDDKNKTDAPPWSDLYIKECIIKDGVTSIGESAFQYCNLHSISIANSVKTIGAQAFSNCSELTSIVFPEGVISLGDSALYECSNLESVIIPLSMTQVGNEIFDGASPNLVVSGEFAEGTWDDIIDYYGNIIDFEIDSSESDTKNRMKGDIIGDDGPTAKDATQILRYIVGMDCILTSETENKEYLLTLADVDDDKEITARDATQILRYEANLSSIYDNMD